eukprot:gene25640-30969_t
MMNSIHSDRKSVKRFNEGDVCSPIDESYYTKMAFLLNSLQYRTKLPNAVRVGYCENGTSVNRG